MPFFEVVLTNFLALCFSVPSRHGFVIALPRGLNDEHYAGPSTFVTTHATIVTCVVADISDISL